MTKTCKNVLNSIDSYLLKKAEDVEAKVFYYKMKGDYNRYIAEYAQGDLKQKVGEDAKKAYEEATKIIKDLPPHHPIALGLALNYSVFYYEVLNDHETACKIARETLENAEKELNVNDENDENEDSISIINLLRENLEMWKIEAEDNQ